MIITIILIANAIVQYYIIFKLYKLIKKVENDNW